MTAAHCEVRLAALRRTKDGTVVSLLIHPNDVPDCLLLDPLGQRYMIGIAAIGDDEQELQSPTGNAAPSHTAVVPEQAENRGAKARYAAKTDQEKAAVRAVLLCRDVRFQDWLYALSPAYRRQRLSDAPPEECAALWMHGECGIASRREIATDYDAYGRFIALENRYKIATGQMAEERG